MTKKGFIKMLMLVAGFMCFVLGMIVSCNEQGILHWTGVLILIMGIILLLAGVFKRKVNMNSAMVFRVVKVLLICALLHGIGIVLMTNVHWLVGIPFVLAGIIGLLFLVPAANGFKED